MVLAFDTDVAGQAAEAEPADHGPENSGGDKNQSDDDQRAGHLVPPPSYSENLIAFRLSSPRAAGRRRAVPGTARSIVRTGMNLRRRAACAEIGREPLQGGDAVLGRGMRRKQVVDAAA